MTRRWLAALVLVVALGAAGVLGWRTLRGDRAKTPAATSQALPDTGRDEAAPRGIETVATQGDALPTGGTPMAERVATIGILNKRNGESRELTMRPGQAQRVGDLVVRLRACEKTAPWEDDPLTGAFVQVDVREADNRWHRRFAGWLFKERPGLNVVQHPVYDVWTKSCTMSWPETGPDTEVLSAGALKASSAKKSPTADDAGARDAEDAPTTPSTAAVSNAT
jgi:hypothetical protein